MILTKRKAIIIASSLMIISLTAVAFATTNMLAVNIGQVIVNPAPVANDVISAADFNGLAATGIGTTTVTFGSSSMTVGVSTTLSVTIKNTGNAPSTVTTPAPTDGHNGAVLTFTLTSGQGASTTIAAGSTETYTWTVMPIAQGTVTNPSFTISWS